jgi:hypothetical protein
MINHHEGRPPHPTYGPPLSGRPVIVAGTVFRFYRAGMMTTVRCSDDFRITITTDGRTWSGQVDGVPLRGIAGNVKRFLSDYAAAEAGVKTLKRKTKESGQ